MTGNSTDAPIGNLAIESQEKQWSEEVAHPALGSSHQFRALFRKSVALQFRQYKTNICQILIPVLLLGLLGVYNLIFTLAVAPLDTSKAELQTANSLFPYYSANAAAINASTYSYPCNISGAPADCGKYARMIWTAGSNQLSNATSIINGIPTFQYTSAFLTSVGLTSMSVPQFNFTDNASDMDNALFQALEDNWNGTRANGDDDENGQYELPTSGLIFENMNIDSASPEKSSLQYTIQLPKTFVSYPPLQFPPNSFKGSLAAGYYATVTMAFVASSFASLVFPKENYTITSDITTMPFDYYTSIFDFPAYMTTFYLPMAVGFALPMFVYQLVYEKSERLFSMMKMMGMSRAKYYLSYYIFSYVLYLIMLAAITIMGFVIVNAMYWHTNPAVYMALFLAWGLAQVSLGFFIAAFFSHTTAATIITYLIWFFSFGIGGFFNSFFYPQLTDLGLTYYTLFLVFPPFAMMRGVYIIISKLNDPLTGAMSWDAFLPSSPMFAIYIYLLVEAVVLFVLGAYLDQVLPQKHGVRKSVIFPIISLVNLVKKKSEQISDEGVETGKVEDVEEGNGEVVDEDVVQEKENAHNGDFKCLLRVSDMRKEYGGGKVALKSLCLAIPDGECFGLLGPNGAGKTTLASILSGLQSPTSGFAEISGYKIPGEVDNIHEFLGFCPQHDILWDDLTIEEHLLFYCRLKGVPVNVEIEHCDMLATKVKLQDDKRKKVSELSGGMKRRLSLAISLIGHPKVVLLDEPTTGLDPASRRTIWDIITEEKTQRCTIVTTHNMEEADVLCNRIGILSQGRLLCIGPQLRLKNKFGKGYKLSLTSNNTNSAREFIQSIFPNAILESVINESLEFSINSTEFNFPKLVRAMQSRNEDSGVLEWGVNQASLEEVFLKLVANEESDS